MRFHLIHQTRYAYADPASESYMEARIAPPSNASQTVLHRELTITPATPVATYQDYFGNVVEYFSIIHRHPELVLDAVCDVETHPVVVPPAAVDISIAEARQIYRTQLLARYDFLRPSPAVQVSREIYEVSNRLFRTDAQLGASVLGLMQWVHGSFKYAPGSTHVETTVAEVLSQQCGVCQDFAHVMIAVLRSAEIPARYVCGYIETDRQAAAARNGEPRLIGAAESHAWVEVGLPNGDWYALDPTNNIPVGHRHVVLSVGRDFHDVSPTRGVFKGAGRTPAQVRVVMRRVDDVNARTPAS